MGPPPKNPPPEAAMGPLARCLARGEYWPLQDCPLFEGEYQQVTRRGDPAGPVTAAVAASSRRLPLPDLLLLARPVPGGSPEELQLTGLLPLRCLRVSVRPPRLRLLLPAGRRFYLEPLGAPPRRRRLLAAWLRLLAMLRDPPGTPGGTDTPQHLPASGSGGTGWSGSPPAGRTDPPPTEDGPPRGRTDPPRRTDGHGVRPRLRLFPGGSLCPPPAVLGGSGITGGGCTPS